MKIGDILHIEPTLEATSGLDMSLRTDLSALVLVFSPQPGLNQGGITRWSSAVLFLATAGGRPSGLSWRRISRP